VILLAFALAIGSLTVSRLRSDFNREVSEAARAIPGEMKVKTNPFGNGLEIRPELRVFAAPGDHAAIRILSQAGLVVRQSPANAPAFPVPASFVTTGSGVEAVDGYRVITELVNVVGERDGQEFFEGRLILQYGRQVGPTERTVRRVELFLLLGVLAGSFLALLAGMAIARRAMAPIAELTSAAADIAATRDPSRRVPEPQTEDEVAELAHTLDSMLRELDAARSDTEAALARQRQFVADASHELRTPLTSVLANLELLAARGQLPGDLGDAARAALRSSQRMRRLVADLLLLARTDAARVAAHDPLDLAQVVVEASAEIGSVSPDHEVILDVEEAPVMGARDELHRLVLNLIENAIRHTPPGTHVHVSTRLQGSEVVLVVEDDGPGVPDEIAATIFNRFVRGSGDRGGSFGLGLAIVSAVAASHGGSVELDRSGRRARAARDDGAGGARFVVRLPARLAPSEPLGPRESVLADRVS
jgi:two-component system, OmpR family, sensor kinase